MRVPEPSERETHSRPERLSTPFHKHVDAFLIRHSPVGHGFTRKLRINTEQLAATKKNLTAETQRTRRFRPWERTLPACPACPTPCTQDACAPRSPRRKILSSLQRIFGLVVQSSGG